MIDDLGKQAGVHRSWKKFATGLAIMMSIALRDRFGRSYWSYFWRHLFFAKNWRRGELNPCPRRCPRRHLHAYPALRFKEPNVAPAHCWPPSVHEIPSPSGAVAPPKD